MKKPSSQNSTFLMQIIVLLAFFVLIFFTKNIYDSIQVNTAEKTNSEIILEEKKVLLSSLNDLNQKLYAEDSTLLEDIEGFPTNMFSHDIFEYIHSYARSVNVNGGNIIIGNIDISEPSQSDFGLLKTEVVVNILASSEEQLFSFIDYLTYHSEEDLKDKKYQFFISDFSFPMGEKNTNFQVNLPLSIYHN